MKIALIIFAVLLAVVACVLIIGALLPRQHRVSRSISLHRPPHEVYSVVRDFPSAPEWRRICSELNRSNRSMDVFVSAKSRKAKASPTK